MQTNTDLSFSEQWLELVKKYNINGPRYTSYPTPLHFETGLGSQPATAALQQLPEDQPLSLYLHIPFCDTLCFYCACNKIVTKKREKADSYIQYLIKEIEIYQALVGTREVRQIHLGGGTPNFLTKQQFTDLITALRNHFHLAAPETLEMGIELDPRSATVETLKTLRDYGFNRLSFGIQDLNPIVQQAVNRVHSREHIQALMFHARRLGFESIHMDFIYGLPHQNAKAFSETLDQVIQMAPDRLSVFNYAHLPMRFPAQRRIDESTLPSPAEKLAILQTAISTLRKAGYQYIGMDHFALPSDTLAQHQNQQRVQRNFQGYTTFAECALIGLGVSAISQIEDVYAQNHRDLESYYADLDAQQLPVWRGYQLNSDDLIRRALINQLICHFELDFQEFGQYWEIDFQAYFSAELAALSAMQKENLVNITRTRIKVTEMGKYFIRNICMLFDHYFCQYQPDKRYSRAL